MNPGNSYRIIVRAPNWLGDAVLATPVLKALRERYRDAHISLAARESVVDCFLHNHAVDEIIKLPDRNSLGYWKKALKLKAGNYDMGILLPNSFNSALFFYAAGIRERIGYNRDCRRLLLTGPVKVTPDIKEAHQADYYLHILNGKPHDRTPVWEIGPGEKEQAKKILNDVGATSRDNLIALAPGARYGPAKRWFPERFASLAAKLVDEYKAQILIFGTAAEKNVSRSIREQVKANCADLTGKTNLRQLGALLSLCKLLVTNDNGAMHVGCAVRTPTVALFGSTSPDRTKPAGCRNTVIYKKVPCSPCFEKKCRRGDYRCFDIITTREVLLASRDMIKNAR